MPQNGEESTQHAERAADALARIRAGLRQRQALLATPVDGSLQLPPSLAGLRAAGHLDSPLPRSPRRWIGPILIVVRKVVYHAFIKWYAPPLLQQQNAFNHGVTLALQDLYERQRLLAQAIADESSRADNVGSGPSPPPS